MDRKRKTDRQACAKVIQADILGSRIKGDSHMPTKDEFDAELRARFRRARERGADSVEVNSGEMHRALGGYPSQKHQMPTCCGVMHSHLKSEDEIISSPKSGKGASLTIRYQLPR
tara:strand:- start:2485 stop:2829 length:345 start_codon:yes stop_codon:yes gene_type:complete